MFLNTNQSAVFGSGNAIIESTLKNPNQYRDAVLYDHLSSLTESKLKEFIKSDEAKMMLNEGLISDDMLEKLSREHHGHLENLTVCHMAKENGDPLWDEFVRLRMEERRLMNELIEKYSEDAAPIANNAQSDFIENCIPEYFR